ncbi:nuclear transport factor 2 family protein [Sphingomonas turrisvirgatae]|uniref:SnoaL-like domain-containing protein n=1 Tax=Sphingomonas turrisvirgatae TaxID=1888892 RepID=A0A1E3LTU9_9SPHN|nr:nuclear transport factor 2 family protein [Sphingomonas turrisvirgatae]ODP37173.1 hypothetical protein BFL28_02780 [Sphingomonas turrisvirgatae]
MTHSNEDRHRVSRRGLAASGLGLASAGALVAAPAKSSGIRSLSLEDRVGIQDLFTDYLWAYDCSDASAFAALFTPDALVVGKGIEYRGREKILAWFAGLIQLREREQDDVWMHEAGQFHFVPTATGCLVYAYATHFRANTAAGERGVRSLGYFACECRKDTRWRFHRFSISPWDRHRLPWTKKLPWAG